MILRDGFRFFSTHCSSLLTLPLSFLCACSSVEPSLVNADGGAEVFLVPTLKPSGHSDTTPLQRVLLLHPEAPRVHWEQPPSWNCQRNQSFPWKFKSGGRGRSSVGSQLLPWGPPSPSSSDVPVPCERDKPGLQGQRAVTSHVLHSPGAPQPWDVVQMHCENPALSISPEKRGAGLTEAPILVSLSISPAIPAPMNILFGCTEKVSCSSEQ